MPLSHRSRRQRNNDEEAYPDKARLELFPQVMCDFARLPVRGVVFASHFVTDLTLGLGEVAFDYRACLRTKI